MIQVCHDRQLFRDSLTESDEFQEIVEGKKMWFDFAVFLVACQVLTFGIIRLVEAISLI
jgi:uncharacterized membrane protein (DUF2068 family)